MTLPTKTRTIDSGFDGGGGFSGGVGRTQYIDSSGGGDGNSVELTPAVVIGQNLRRDDLETKPEALTPAPTIEALSKDRRKRAGYSETKKKRPVTSGLKL